jgi:hypothetical protein
MQSGEIRWQSKRHPLIKMTRREVYPRSQNVARLAETMEAPDWIKQVTGRVSCRLPVQPVCELLEFDGDAFDRGAGKAVDVVYGNKAIQTARDRDIDERVSSFLSERFFHRGRKR